MRFFSYLCRCPLSGLANFPEGLLKTGSAYLKYEKIRLTSTGSANNFFFCLVVFFLHLS